jgi:AraC-like DNA-binding protein
MSGMGYSILLQARIHVVSGIELRLHNMINLVKYYAGSRYGFPTRPTDCLRMNYHPSMNNKIDGFSVIKCSHRRYWDGMVADLWDVACSPRAGGSYEGGDPRLFILLDADGSPDRRFEVSANDVEALPDFNRPAVSFIPAGMPMQTRMRGFHSLRHLDLHFDRDSLARRLGEDFDEAMITRPRFLLSEPRLIALAELIAAECAAAEPLHDLYGDGLTLALLLAVLRLPPSASRPRGRLAQWQLRRVTDYIVENCARNIRIEELADLTGLSQSYFSHAFKASTGLPPHQWQMKARIDRVKTLLNNRGLSLTEIAAETGFSDPAHFTRMFRRQTGASPSAWRREHVA